MLAAMALGVALASKLCASVYTDFQDSATYEHLCDELSGTSRSPRRSGGVYSSGTASPGTNGLVGGSGGSTFADNLSVSTQLNSPSSPDSSCHSLTGGIEKVAQSPPRQLQGAHARGRSSPFMFVGGSGSAGGSPGHPESLHHHLRRSTSTTSVGADSGSTGGGDGGGRDPWAEALAFRSGGGKSRDVEVPMVLSGPEFSSSWESSQGSILEKVMRRIELPSHVSRHRPPLAASGGGGGGSGKYAPGNRVGGTETSHTRRRFSRSGSGTSCASGEPSSTQVD